MAGSGSAAKSGSDSSSSSQDKEVSESNHFNEVIKDLKTVLLKHHTLIKEVCDDIGKEHQESAVLRNDITTAISQCLGEALIGCLYDAVCCALLCCVVL